MTDEGRKHDTGKTRWDLMPWGATEKIAEVMTYGATKYGDTNWQKVPGLKDRYFAAAMRHMMAWHHSAHHNFDMLCDSDDKESGLPHLAHAIASLMFILEYEEILEPHDQG